MAAASSIGANAGTSARKGYDMDLTIWLPAMFLLGVVSMVGCYAFIRACEKI